MPTVKHKTPCKQCPFRKESLPGWLGGSTPEEFMDQTMRQQEDMPCHITVDYEDPDWKKKLAKTPQCAGSLIFLNNSGHRDLRPSLAKKAAQFKTDYMNLLVGPGHFIAHHSEKLRKK